MPLSLQSKKTEPRRASRFILWIDGVGGFLVVVCTGRHVSIGGPGAADFTLAAPLSRWEASLIAEGEEWFIERHDTRTRADGLIEEFVSPVQMSLHDHDEIRLGDSVRLQFDVPNPLSRTAVLTPTSGHRPTLGVDACLLMRRNLVLGPGATAHVRCREWPGDVVLFESSGRICWRPFDADRSHSGEPVRPGDVVETEGFGCRFHIEPVE